MKPHSLPFSFSFGSVEPKPHSFEPDPATEAQAGVSSDATAAEPAFEPRTAPSAPHVQEAPVAANVVDGPGAQGAQALADAVDDGPGMLGTSALLASKVCHDLINPLGAITVGIEVLDTETDPEMRAEALRLIDTSAKKAVAGLSYARIAYGAGGAFGSEMELDNAKKAAADMFEYVKADLDWRMASGAVPKDVAKVALVMAVAAADCAPRGGTVTVDGNAQLMTITAQGKKARLYDKLAAALGGDATELEPKWTPAFICGAIARGAGGGIEAVAGEEEVTIQVRFAAAMQSPAEARHTG